MAEFSHPPLFEAPARAQSGEPFRISG